jgi:hypothetical protein
MKRIVNGTTYNTETSTELARREGEPEDGAKKVETLHVTRGGAFFAIEETARTIWNEREDESETRVTNSFIPMSAEKAHNWMMTGDVEVFRNPFEDPPEASAEAEPGATIYVRVPLALKRSVDEAAGEAGVSGNVWAMRCIERCLGGFPQELAKIFHIARGLTVHWEDDRRDGRYKFGKDAKLDKYKLDKATEALEEISSLIEDFAKDRFGADDLAKIVDAIYPELADINRRYQPYPDER